VGNLNNTNVIMNNTFFIGVYTGINDDHIRHISKTVSRFMAGERI
jgi:dTDP-4-amino-4,6-dideoxygalactose transaminase